MKMKLTLKISSAKDSLKSSSSTFFLFFFHYFLHSHGNDEFKVIDMYIENKVWEAVKDQEFIASVIEEGPPSEDEEPPPEEKNA